MTRHDEPTDLPKRSWWDTLKRTIREFSDDNITDWAAALTYYAMLALFPALIALVSLVGLVADPATTTLVVTDTITSLVPSSPPDLLIGPLKSITQISIRAGI